MAGYWRSRSRQGGRAKVDADPAGEEFPWHPKPLNELDGGCTEYIIDTSVVVAFDDSDAVKAAMEPLAAAWVVADKAAGGDPTLMWLFAGSTTLWLACGPLQASRGVYM